MMMHFGGTACCTVSAAVSIVGSTSVFAMVVLVVLWVIKFKLAISVAHGLPKIRAIVFSGVM